MTNVVLSVWVSGEWSYHLPQALQSTVDLTAFFDAFAIDPMAQIIVQSLTSDKFKV
jgi:hypothetical protein